ncbi:hypothetical protein DFH07DRAFT_1023316, partial [Mycena maculata]
MPALPDRSAGVAAVTGSSSLNTIPTKKEKWNPSGTSTTARALCAVWYKNQHGSKADVESFKTYWDTLSPEQKTPWNTREANAKSAVAALNGVSGIWRRMRARERECECERRAGEAGWTERERERRAAAEGWSGTHVWHRAVSRGLDFGFPRLRDTGQDGLFTGIASSRHQRKRRSVKSFRQTDLIIDGV